MSEKLDREALRRVLAPVAKANGMPSEFYTDEELFEQEKKDVFHANWACIGFGKDIPEKGDAKPIDYLGSPLLMLRDNDGEIKVFHNVCSHRGAILVDEPKKIRGVIRCPYHSWCYGLKGDLRSTPHIGGAGQDTHPDFDHSKHGLREVRAHVWLDFVFVNLDGQAPEFEQAAGKLLKRWEEFASRNLTFTGEDSHFEFELNTNWKLAIENYCESYHLPWIHPALNSYSRIEDHYNIVEEGVGAGQGTRVYNPVLSADGTRIPDFEGISDQWETQGEYIVLFPNLMLGVHRDHAFGILVEPVGPHKTKESVVLYYGSEEAAQDKFEALRAKNSQLWKTVFAEDVYVVESMQRGRASQGFDGGVFSPALDEATHAFHHWVASQYLKDELEATKTAAE